MLIEAKHLWLNGILYGHFIYNNVNAKYSSSDKTYSHTKRPVQTVLHSLEPWYFEKLRFWTMIILLSWIKWIHMPNILDNKYHPF